MKDTSVFEQLTQSLDTKDRKELLNKILQSTSLPSEPLNKGPDVQEVYDLEKMLSSLSFFQRIIVFIRMLFTHKDRKTLCKEYILKKMVVQINRKCPDLADFHNSLFLEKMHHHLEKLGRNALFYKNSLNNALGKDKIDFFSFLAKDELKYYQDKIIEETNPYKLWQKISPKGENDVRIEMFSRFNEILESIPQESRTHIRQDVNSFYALKSLSDQPFDFMHACFKPGHSSGNTCTFRKLIKHLQSLAEHLRAAEFPPSLQALYALSLFIHREDLEDDDFDLADRLKSDLLQFKKALAGIRDFNTQIPLVMIIKYISANIEYYPGEITGGDEWFALYRNFWKQRLDKDYRGFLKYRTHEKLKQSSLEYLGITNHHELIAYRAESFSHGIIPRHTLSLSFLSGFAETVFKDMHRPLKLLLLSGEFYKEENRRSMTDAFNTLNKIEDRIKELDNQLQSGGVLGKQIEETRREVITSQLKRKKLQTIYARANNEAMLILSESLNQLKNLTNILKGVLYGQPGAKFDTIQNLTTLGGRENKQLINSWTDALEKIENVCLLLIAIKELELND